MNNKYELNQLRRRCRHKAEIPLIILSVIITAFTMYILVYYGIIAEESPEAIQAISNVLGCDLQTADHLLDFRVYIAVVLLVLIPGKFLWAFYRDKGKAMAWEVPINDRQYGFIMNIWQEYADQLGLKESPAIYASTGSLIQLKNISVQNLNILRISPIMLRSGPEDDGKIRFVVAREAAAMFLRYQNPLMPFLLTCSNWIPLLNSCINRAICYSVDRIVRELLGDEEAVQGLIKSIISPYLHSTTDFDAYVSDLNACRRFRDRLVIFIENLRSEEPVPQYRIAAMTDPEKKDGRLF